MTAFALAISYFLLGIIIIIRQVLEWIAILLCWIGLIFMTPADWLGEQINKIKNELKEKTNGH